MAYDAGNAYLTILPSFRGIEKAIGNELEKVGRRVEATVANALPEGMRKGAKEASAEGEKAGDKFAGAFATVLRRRLDAALKALPKAEITADSSEAEREITEIRERLATLRDQVIEVGVDEGEAIAEIEYLSAKLRELSRQNPEVTARFNAGAAQVELAAFAAEIRRLSGQTLDVDTSLLSRGLNDATSAAGVTIGRLGALIGLGASIGTAIVPAAAAATAAIGFIGAAAAASGSALGVFVLGISGIGKAVGALSKYQDDADESSASLARSQNQVASALDGVRSAERGLANTREQVAYQAKQSAQRVADAQRSIVDAQRAVVDAQRQEKLAIQDLVRAREEARRQQEDMLLQIKDIALAQRQSNLDVAEAKKNLDKVLADPKATKEQREQARITYEERVLQLQRLGVQQKRLAADQKAANKAGINGSDQVRSAQERVRSATEAVASAQRRLADSQRRLADAVESQQQQQRQGAQQLASAQQSLVSAQRSLEQATISAGTAGGAAMDNLRDAMDKLSPAGQRFAKFIFGLKDEFLSLRGAAEGGLLPGLQRSIQTLLPYLPRFRGFVSDVAEALGGMFERTAKFLTTDPTWRRFFGFIGSSAVPTLQRLERIGRNVATGLAGLFLAFTPFNEDFGGGLERFTERFAHWATTLERNQGFQRFLAYVRDVGPEVVRLIGEMATFLFHLVEAAAPVGRVVVQVFTQLFNALNGIPIGLLTVFIATVGIMSTVVLGLAGATRAFIVAQSTANTLTAIWQRLQAGTTSLMQRYQTAMGGATTATGRFNAVLGGVSSGAGAARRGLSNMVSFLGGPWGVAVAGATVAAGLFIGHTIKQKQKNDELRNSLVELAAAFEQEGGASGQGVQDLIRRNEQIRNLVLNSQQYGVSIDQIVAGLNGERAAQDQVAASLRAHIQALKDEANAILTRKGVSAEEAKTGAARLKAIAVEVEQTGNLERALRGEFSAKNQATQATDLLAQSSQKLTPAQQALADAQRVLADNTSTAQQKVDALRAAEDALTDASRTQTEAGEQWSRTLLNLREGLTQNKGALDRNSQAGLNNRDSLQAAARASVDLYYADIKAGVSIAEATKKHRGRIAALIEEAKKTGANKGVVNELIGTYGKIPDEVETVISVAGYGATGAKLLTLLAQQNALQKGIPLSQAKANIRKQYQAEGQRAPKFAEGGPAGPVVGPGTGTSDSILAWLSNGEYVIPANIVKQFGIKFFDWLIGRQPGTRQMRDGGEDALYARGGPVKWPFPVDVTKIKLPTVEQLRDQWTGAVSGAGQMFGRWPSSPSAQRGDSGVWRKIVSLIKSTGPLSGRFGNAYRPGDPKWHGSGRAVDWMGYNQDALAGFLAARGPLELIHRGRRDYAFTRGRNQGSFNRALMEAHRNHIHVAFDAGGWLTPNMLPVNNLRAPEPVLTPGQWRDIHALAAANVPGGNTYNFEFRDTTLDGGKLRAIQDREAAMSRAGRAR